MTWTLSSAFTHTQTQSQFSVDDDLSSHARSRPDSQRPLLPERARVAHPYSQVLTSSLADESFVETPVTAAVKSSPVVGGVSSGPKRNVTTIREVEAPVRRSAFVPYEPRPFEEERERERERDRARFASAWRRKIKV